MILKKMAAVLALALLPLAAVVVVDSPAYAGTAHMHLSTALDNFFLSFSPASFGPQKTVIVSSQGPGGSFKTR